MTLLIRTGGRIKRIQSTAVYGFRLWTRKESRKWIPGTGNSGNGCLWIQLGGTIQRIVNCGGVHGRKPVTSIFRRRNRLTTVPMPGRGNWKSPPSMRVQKPERSKKNTLPGKRKKVRGKLRKITSSKDRTGFFTASGRCLKKHPWHRKNGRSG